MIIDREGDSRWFSAHIFKIDHLSVGRTKIDVEESFATANTKGNTIKKFLGLPLGQEAGQSINKMETWVLKVKEIATKISAIVPILGGFAFLSKASSLMSESSGQGPEAAWGGVLGVIGLAAISLMPVLAWETGRAYGLMHKWAKDEGLKSVYFGRTHWPGNKQ